MEVESVYIARMPPYTLSDLENFKSKIEKNRFVKIFTIGETVEKKPLEIIQIGNPEARKSILIRARSHPWESGGNWVIEGLVNRFLSENSDEWIEAFCVYIMPMANKDGVVRGMTRFNLNGMDLNRNWDAKSDPDLCPEKFAFEEYIEKLIAGGSKPCLAIDIHNDDSGGFHLSRYVKEVPALAENMKLLEKLMREKTTYAEDVKYSSDRVVTLSCGMYQRYGIEAIIYEINANWMKNPGKVPTAKDWMEIGENMNDVFYEYTMKMN
jgi:predicted deacylase